MKKIDSQEEEGDIEGLRVYLNEKMVKEAMGKQRSRNMLQQNVVFVVDQYGIFGETL